MNKKYEKVVKCVRVFLEVSCYDKGSRPNKFWPFNLILGQYIMIKPLQNALTSNMRIQ